MLRFSLLRPRRLVIAGAFFSSALLQVQVPAEEPAAAASPTPAAVTSATASPAVDPVARLVIAPSSTKVKIATADLTVGALDHKEKSYQGSYKIKITPFAFKNDHGSLFLEVSESQARRMAQGEAVEFKGKATSEKDGKIKPIKGKTNPENKEEGAVSFTVYTEDGELHFNTSYQVVMK